MGYKTVRALIPVRHSGVLRIPGTTTGINAQDFTVAERDATRMAAMGVVDIVGTAFAPSAIDSLTGKAILLPAIRQGIQMVMDGLDDAYIALDGDSTDVGGGAGTGGLGLVGAEAGSPTAHLCQFLRERGYPAADNSWFGEHLIQAFNGTSFASYAPRFSLLGGASHYPNGQQQSVGGVMTRLNAAGHGVAYVPQIDGADSKVDRVRVFYCNRTVGSFAVLQPGSATVAQTITTNATQTIGSVLVPLQRGTGPVTFSWVSGDVWIIGARYTDSQNPRVNIMNFGTYGDRQTSQWGVANCPFEWRAGAVMAQMGLHGLFMNRTINSIQFDGSAGVDAFVVAQKKVAQEVAVSGSDVVMRTPHGLGTVNQGVVSDAYVAGINSAAAELGLNVCTENDKIVYAVHSGNDYFDTLHLSARGYRRAARLLGQYMLRNAGL